MGGGKGTSSSTNASNWNTNQTQTYTANPDIAQNAQRALEASWNAVQDYPWTADMQQNIAPLTAYQNQAGQEIANLQGYAQPYFDQAGAYMQAGAAPITGSDVNQYYNPMASSVTAQMQNIFGQQNQQNNASLINAAGGVGADRIAVGQGQLANQQGLAAGQTYAGLYQNALQAAQQQKQQQLAAGYGYSQMGPAAQAAQLQGAQALNQAGQQQQAVQQAQYNAYYQWQQGAYAHQYQTPQYLASIAGGLAPALGGTTTGQGFGSSNSFGTATPAQVPVANQAIGLGTSLAGAFGGKGSGGRVGMERGGNVYPSKQQFERGGVTGNYRRPFSPGAVLDTPNTNPRRYADGGGLGMEGMMEDGLGGAASPGQSQPDSGVMPPMVLGPSGGDPGIGTPPGASTDGKQEGIPMGAPLPMGGGEFHNNLNLSPPPPPSGGGGGGGSSGGGKGGKGGMGALMGAALKGSGGRVGMSRGGNPYSRLRGYDDGGGVDDFGGDFGGGSEDFAPLSFGPEVGVGGINAGGFDGMGGAGLDSGTQAPGGWTPPQEWQNSAQPWPSSSADPSQKGDRLPLQPQPPAQDEAYPLTVNPGDAERSTVPQPPMSGQVTHDGSNYPNTVNPGDTMPSAQPPALPRGVQQQGYAPVLGPLQPVANAAQDAGQAIGDKLSGLFAPSSRASVRNNNPGAQWPGPVAKQFGMSGYQNLSDGNKIATFPTPVHGAAAQFALLDKSYSGMPLMDAIHKWTGGNSSASYARTVSQNTGIPLGAPITRELLQSPQGIALAQAMAHNEAGGNFPMTQQQWAQGQQMAFGQGTGAGMQNMQGNDTSSPGSGLTPDNVKQAAGVPASVGSRFDAAYPNGPQPTLRRVPQVTPATTPGMNSTDAVTGRQRPYNPDMGVEDYQQPRSQQPYPNRAAESQSWGQRLAHSPNMALIRAGASIASNTGGIGTALASGINAGATELATQRKQLESEEGLNQRAQGLFQQAKQHLNQYQRVPASTQAILGARQQQGNYTVAGQDEHGNTMLMNRKTGQVEAAPQNFTPAAKPTAIQSNANWLMQNGIAKSPQEAFNMAHAGVNDGATWQRLVQAEKRLLMQSPEGVGLPPEKLEQQAQQNVVARRQAMQNQGTPLPPPPAGGGTPAASSGQQQNSSKVGETKQFKQGTYRKIKDGPDNDPANWQKVE